MSDLISRQAAIDMIRLYREDEAVDLDELESSIAMMPAAQKTQLSTEDTTLDTTFDCISRREAIDALKRDEEYDEDIPNRADGVRDAIITISGLPAAQPEVIRCKDCEWFRKEYGWNCIEYTVCGVSPTHHPIRAEEDFCSHAERRTDG